MKNKSHVVVLVAALLLVALATPSAHAMEGCKYKHPVNTFQLAQCSEYYLNGVPAIQCSTNGYYPTPPPNSVDSRYFTVELQAETGEKCEVMGPTTSLHAILGADHASSLMDDFLFNRLNSPVGSASMSGVTPYYTSIFGWTSCGGGYTPETWTNTIWGQHTGISYSYSVKRWWANVGGQGCETETHVTP
jgi:hypothetical protein